MKIRFWKRVFVLIISLLCFSVNVYAFNASTSNFEVIVRPSQEEHLDNGMISYHYMGIDSGLWWGTTKFEMSVDGGKTWFYAYCLNNDLGTPDDILNKNLDDFEHTFNNQNMKKILYYGYNKDTWDSEGYDYVRRHSYYIWMPVYNKGVLTNWVENWTEDFAYCLTHLALSYAYYHDVYGLSEEESEKRAFYGVFESNEMTGTKAKSVAKMWYEYLISKPDIGIKLHLQDGHKVDAFNMIDDKYLNTGLGKEILIKGESMLSDLGGKIEFTVPDDLNCNVTGNSEGASDSGVYESGSKVTIGAGQSFSFSLAKAAKNLENINLSFYENYNVIKISGGKTEDGVELQDVAGLYKSSNEPQQSSLSFKDGFGTLKLTKKVIGGNEKKYHVGIFNEDNSLFDVVEINLESGTEKTEEFYVPTKIDGETKYYIKETDEFGVPINRNDLRVSIDNGEVVFSSDESEWDVTILNNYYPATVESPQTGVNTPLYLLVVSLILLPLIFKLNKKINRNMNGNI